MICSIYIYIILITGIPNGIIRYNPHRRMSFPFVGGNVTPRQIIQHLNVSSVMGLPQILLLLLLLLLVFLLLLYYIYIYMVGWLVVNDG